MSRFTVTGSALDTESEQVLLSVPTQGGCCHEAGSLAFGPDGNLYFSTGTTRTRSRRKGTRRSTSARGAPSGMPRGRRVTRWTCAARSFVSRRATMAATRSRPAISSRAGAAGLRFTRWGCEIPFASRSIRRPAGSTSATSVPTPRARAATRGPRGYDEINRARQAGNYGSPYCLADNEPYIDYDFDTGLSGTAFDCAAPTNDSPNNTGNLTLPPAKGPCCGTPTPTLPKVAVRERRSRARFIIARRPAPPAARFRATTTATC